MRNLVGGVMTPPYEAINNNLPKYRRKPISPICSDSIIAESSGKEKVNFLLEFLISPEFCLLSWENMIE